MLLFAASMDGQGAIAIQAGKDYAKLTGDTLYHVLTLLRFGRFDEIAAVTERPATEVSGGLWDFAQGYAHLRNGEADFARVYLDRVRRTAGTTEQRLRFHPGGDILGIAAAILEGEIHRNAEDLERSIRAFEAAVAQEDALMYDEPEPLPFAARHWLGAAPARGGPPRRRRAGVPRGPGRPPAQRLVAVRPQGRPRCAGQVLAGSRTGPGRKLGARRYLAAGIALLGIRGRHDPARPRLQAVRTAGRRGRPVAGRRRRRGAHPARGDPAAARRPPSR